MAIKTVLVDDMDGGQADVTIAFAVNGESYSIDLSRPNADMFWKLLGPYIEAGVKNRKTNHRSEADASHASGVSQRAAIREWARERGIEVADRGRIPLEVIEAFNNSGEND